MYSPFNLLFLTILKYLSDFWKNYQRVNRTREQLFLVSVTEVIHVITRYYLHDNLHVLSTNSSH